MVEIGGSFRVPEIMESSRAELREVGTTNRTHLRDYAQTIGLRHCTAAGVKARGVDPGRIPQFVISVGVTSR